MAILKIDNYEVSLGNNNLVFSKSAYSFQDWITKDIPYSERITLPETSLLNTIFFRPYSPEITGQKFSRNHTFKYLDNSKIVNSGIARLLSFNDNNEYEVQLIDSSFNLFSNIDGILSDLDFESSDFTYNSGSYADKRVLNSSVWIWSASSMHTDKILAKNILSGNLAFSRPFLSAKRLIEKMFSDNGWTYTLDDNSSLFDKIIISAKSNFVFTSYEKKFNATIYASDLNLSTPVFLKTDTLTGTTVLNLTYNSTFRFRGYIDATENMVITITATGPNPQVQNLQINKGLFYYDLTSNEFQAGSAVTFALSGVSSIELIDFILYTIINENDFGAMSGAIFTDFKVKTYDNLPEITQKELFKHCLVKIGGFFTSDNFSKKIIISSLKSLNKLNVVDFSAKYIYNSDNVSMLEYYGKNNYFNYNNNSEKSTNLGKGLFTIDNEVLENVKDIYSSIFEASSEVVITNSMIDNSIYDDTERILDTNVLIAYYEVIGAYTVARFDLLNGNNILLSYYENFIKAIQRGEIFESKFNLNKSDYFNFDFTKLIYISSKKSIFYCLGISDYSENEMCTIQLLKF